MVSDLYKIPKNCILIRSYIFLFSSRATNSTMKLLPLVLAPFFIHFDTIQHQLIYQSPSNIQIPVLIRNRFGLLNYVAQAPLPITKQVPISVVVHGVHLCPGGYLFKGQEQVKNFFPPSTKSWYTTKPFTTSRFMHTKRPAAI